MIATEAGNPYTVARLFRILFIGNLLIFICSILAVLPSLVRLAEFHQFELGGFSSWLKHRYFPLVALSFAAAVPFIFCVMDLHISQNIPNRRVEFRTYVIHTDIPACATMLLIASLAYFLPDLEIFSAGAHVFTFAGFNMAFTLSSINTFKYC
jgi:hypothetical protein